MEQLPLPTSLGEVESLIRALYQPNQPETISQIQDVLQRLQRSPQGWQLAQSLFANRDDNIRFYAALTIIVKLNRDSPGLTEDESKELLQNIVGWVIQSLVEGSATFVVKKLCSALVTYFIHFPQHWPLCLRHFIYCLDIGRGAPVEVLDEALQTSLLVGNLEPSKLKVAVWFATSLVEEVGKTDMNSTKYLNVHNQLAKNGPDATCLLATGFSLSSDNYIQGETIHCFQAWILYAQRVPSSASALLLLDPLRQLVDPAINTFADPDLFQDTAELFSDVLSNYSAFFTEAHYASLAAVLDSPWAAEKFRQLIQRPGESIAFGLLMLAYGDARVADLIESTDEQSQRLLGRLVGLLDADGYLVGEDTIFVPALEFWSTFVETMIDAVYDPSGPNTSWRQLAEQHLRNVVMNCWGKIQWPPVEVFAEWDSSERVGFSDARKDVADLLQSVFAINGGQLVAFFADLSLQSVATRAWAEVEASVFCLGSLSDCISENAEMDAQLAKVFAAPFFEMLGGGETGIPLRLRQTGLQLIERYKEYFERHAEYLPHALNLLFIAVDDPVLAGHSARAIATLCLSCRAILTGEVEAFLGQYQRIRSGNGTTNDSNAAGGGGKVLLLDSLAEERIVLAIAGIIQAISDEGRKMDMFQQLYGFLRADFERAVNLKADPGLLNLADPNYLRGVETAAATHHQPRSQQGGISADEVALQIALRGLRCLSSMAKGMQDVMERIIDLDSEPRPLFPSQGKLAPLQADIIGLMAEVQRTFYGSSEVVVCICNIYRAGFSETEPGPFVFPPDMVTEFLVSQAAGSTPRPGTLLSLACSFVGSLYRGPKAVVLRQLERLLPWVISLLQGLSGMSLSLFSTEPEADTEVAQNGIQFVDRAMSKYPEVLFQIQPQQMLEFFFLFSLEVLNGKEPLPKGAAADFWSAFISLKPETPELQSFITNAMDQTLGPLIAQSLMQNIGGNAARSELDKLSDPLKKLVVKQVHAQQWLEQALFADNFPSKTVTSEEKTMFLKRIVALRGARATNAVVREFWLACRGSNFAYAS
ncbi:armadillo-type protein [Apodospora peruviana]|uniref:Armadillo-type protein n=1 Tax=Apodospora peruviana TaxID=516989 RepID=A0AAE0HVN9_9PEZI|nr:armadillo-type protein [Apodospora peruviana]